MKPVRLVRVLAALIAMLTSLGTASIVAAATPAAALLAEESSGLILPGWVGWLGVLLALGVPIAALVWYRRASGD